MQQRVFPADATLDDQQRWAAVAHNDASFDGRFFYAVTSTGIFCRPGCPSKQPKREHVRFFNSACEAQQGGFRPCKRCRPDLVAYDPLQALTAQAKQLMDAHYAKREALMVAGQQLGVTPHRLNQLFKARYGVTLQGYCAQLRLQSACRLLSQGELSILAVAEQAGFGSLSAFYRFFRQQTGLSPARYRQQSLHQEVTL